MEESKKKDWQSKLSNYWYYYKMHTLFGIFVIIVIVIMVFSCRQRNVPVLATIVDSTAALGRADTEEMLADFAEYAGIDEDSVIFRNTGEYINDIMMNEDIKQGLGVKDLSQSLTDGDLEAIFTVRGHEVDEQYIGNIEDILPQEIIDELGENVMAGYLEDVNGNIVETDNPAGIVVNDAPRFKETYGELKDIIVLQIPSNAKNKEQAIAFVKYLFELE